jgi:NarL family two-component system sensor histidine kinase YdfH
VSDHATVSEEGATDSDLLPERLTFAIVYLLVTLNYALALSEPELRAAWPWVPITALILVQALLYWNWRRVTGYTRGLAIYLAVQAALTFTIGILTGAHGLSIVLYLGLIAFSTSAFWHEQKKAVLVSAVCYALLALNLLLSQGPQGLLASLSNVLAWSAVVLIFVALLNREWDARRRDRALLCELESAHHQLQTYAEQLEELTISKERERMARELHDTLAQGVAGLILQLEAIDSHLENGDYPRAQTGVQQAMQRSRKTLREARAAIRALRSPALEQGDLTGALHHEVESFSARSAVPTTFEAQPDAIRASPDVSQEILRITQESLTNVARHAQAGHVLVRLTANDGVTLLVQDDGVGFDVAEGLARPDCYGLAVMQERAERIGGILHVESMPGYGTRVELDVRNPDHGVGTVSPQVQPEQEVTA